MSSTNIWVGMGRLVDDPNVKSIKKEGEELTIARYRIAIDRVGSKEKRADFISCKCFDKLAKVAEAHLKKGDLVTVTGRIETSVYEKDGEKKYATEVLVKSQDFASPKNSHSNTESSSLNEIKDISEDDFDDESFDGKDS